MLRHLNKTHVDLCSGIGGFALGLDEGAKLSKPILFCDTEQWCHKVLKKNFPSIPIFNDVKEIANDPKRFIPKKPDILTSGYPCQPFSVAGNRRGQEDPRHIFPYIFRIVEQTRPSYVIYENVYGHLSLGLDEVLFKMESIDYCTRTFVFPSSSIGAWHKRDRLWIVCRDLSVCDTKHNGSSSTTKSTSNEENARGTQKGTKETKQLEGTSRSIDNEYVSNSNDKRIRSCVRGSDNDLQKESREWRDDGSRSSSNDGWSDVKTTKNENLELSNTTCERLEGRIIQSNMEREQRQIVTERSVEEQLSWWEVERQLHGVPNGISTELDKDRKQRLIGLGNAICPQNAMYLGLALRGEFNGTS